MLSIVVQRSALFANLESARNVLIDAPGCALSSTKQRVNKPAKPFRNEAIRSI